MSDMNRIFFLRKEDRKPRWIEINAEGQILGRLATKIADILRGKHKPHFTPHTDAGDYVVVTNVDKIVMSGNKWDTKIIATYSGWIGGLKELKARDVHAKHPTHLLQLAVRRMLPKSKMGKAQIKKLKLYASDTHPHTAQVNTK